MGAVVNLRRIEAAVLPVLDQECVELVDVEYQQEMGRWVLRFYLDKMGGMTLDDCEYMSNRIEAVLDAADLIPHSYTLEVSSPGLDRILKKERDFARFSGHRIRIRLKEPRGDRRHFMGYLKDFSDGRVHLESDGAVLSWGLDEIEEARLAPEVEV